MAEQDLRSKHQLLMGMKVKGMFIVGLFMLTFVTTLNKSFTGTVVARIPFTPPGLFRNFTHYGIPGNDYTECSITFAFLLCNMSVATYLKKILALEGPRIDGTGLMMAQYY